MSWFKIDDKLHDHRKARKAGKAAMGVWALAGSWCMANGSDGFVPSSVLSRWGTKKDALRLVESQLWSESSRNGEDGWQFHDWLKYQPDARTMRLKQEAESEAGSLGNHIRWHKRRGVSDPECPHCVPQPDQVPDRQPDRVPDTAPDRGPDRVTIAPPESGANPPSRPVPSPVNTPVVAAVVEPDLGGDRELPPPGPAEQLIAEWLKSLGPTGRPPTKVITQIGQQVAELFADGLPYRDIRSGLIAWQRKGTLGPALLPNLVHEVRTTRPPAGDRRQESVDRTFDQALAWAADQEQKAIGT